MIQITPHMRILLAVEPADFRKGIDGLAALCRKALKADPFSGTVFVFRNRKKTARCERMMWFFDSLNSSQNSLRLLSIADVDAFIEAKGSNGWRRSSLASLASSLRSFFYYAEGRGWCNPGIAAAIESPRLYAQEGIPEGPSWKDVQRLLASTRGDRPADVRDHAILMLLAIYGLRRGEVARLQLDDLDWVGEQIVVARSKQRRIQCYPLLFVVGEAILRYLRKVRPLSTA